MQKVKQYPSHSTHKTKVEFARMCVIKCGLKNISYNIRIRIIIRLEYRVQIINILFKPRYNCQD